MARYFFHNWLQDGADGGTNVQKSVVVGTLDINLVANYALGYIMNITTDAPVPVRFNIGSPAVQQQTPFNNVLEGGTYSLEALDLTISGYRFIGWSDGVTTAARTYNLTADMTTPLVIRYAPISQFDFSINASPSSQTVTQGGSAPFNINTQLISSPATTVNLSVSGLPANTTASFSPSSGMPTFPSTLTVTTTGNTPSGTYTLTMTGTSGSIVHSTTVTLVVNPATVFDFSLNASPASQPVTVGNSTSFAVAIALISAPAQVVTLGVVGMPSNVTSGFSVVSNYPTFNSSLTITTSANTPTGTYTLTITGTGTGGLQRSTTVTLQVNPIVVQKGTIQVKAMIGSAEVTNASGDIKDPNDNIVDTFTSTPHSWDQAVVGTQYTVTCRLAGYADKVDTATVASEGQSVPKSFQFSLQAGFPIWVIAVVGGVGAVGLVLAARKKK